jgi:hypothetical protein
MIFEENTKSAKPALRRDLSSKETLIRWTGSARDRDAGLLPSNRLQFSF